MFSRNQIRTLKERLKEPKRFIQIISGPRQAGKTTLVEQFLQTYKHPHHYVSADAVPASSRLWISQQWEAARIMLSTSGAASGLLVVDEIQKINNWSEVVKKEWDRDKKNRVNLKVVLLGSSTLLIQKGLSESLTGRFELIKMPHWSFNEMKEAFGFTADQYLWYGGFPGAAPMVHEEKRWKDYVLNSIIETTISKDILSLTPILKPVLLKNLFELGCFYSGQILSYRKMLGQLQERGNAATLAHYQSILDNVWLLSGLQKFSKAKVRSKSSIPKWQVYNAALLSVYSGFTMKSAFQNSEFLGRQIESMIGSCLLNYCRINNWQLFYWREGDKEVDFVLKAERKIHAIEVKSGRTKIHKGMTEFDEQYKPSKSILISNDAIRWQDFISFDLEEIF